jgi:hypothetical protein
LNSDDEEQVDGDWRQTGRQTRHQNRQTRQNRQTFEDLGNLWREPMGESQRNTSRRRSEGQAEIPARMPDWSSQTELPPRLRDWNYRDVASWLRQRGFTMFVQLATWDGPLKSGVYLVGLSPSIIVDLYQGATPLVNQVDVMCDAKALTVSLGLLPEL